MQASNSNPVLFASSLVYRPWRGFAGMRCSGCCCDTCLPNTEGKLRAATDARNDTAKTSGSWFSGADNSTGPRSVTEQFRQLLKIPLDLDYYIFSFALLQGFVNMVVSNMCCAVHPLSELLHKALTQREVLVHRENCRAPVWKNMWKVYFRQERN